MRSSRAFHQRGQTPRVSTGARFFVGSVSYAIRITYRVRRRPFCSPEPPPIAAGRSERAQSACPVGSVANLRHSRKRMFERISTAAHEEGGRPGDEGKKAAFAAGHPLSAAPSVQRCQRSSEGWSCPETMIATIECPCGRKATVCPSFRGCLAANAAFLTFMPPAFLPPRAPPSRCAQTSAFVVA